MRCVATVCLTSLFLLGAAACGGSSGYGDLGNPGASVPPSSSSSEGSSDDAGAGSSGTGATQSPPGTGGSPGDASSPVTPPSSPSPGSDAGSPPTAVDAGSPSQAPDAGSSPSGPPGRNAKCTPLSQQTGTAVNTNHGRLDGTLVYVLPIDGSSSCNGDSAHVHLQVDVAGSVYDVAVDIGKSGDEVGWYEESLALPGGAWAEGWHGTDGLGYRSLGLSASAFTMQDPTSMGTEVESLLANTSKISIFCTGYTPEDNGCHDVHYQDGTSQDGAIALDPTSPTSPVVFFRFAGDSF
jgi:hypothetical protein